MIPEPYRHHVEELSLLVALSVICDDNVTASDNAPPGDGKLYEQRQCSATMTENSTASDNAPPWVTENSTSGGNAPSR
jgi:hypothetical protein